MRSTFTNLIALLALAASLVFAYQACSPRIALTTNEGSTTGNGGIYGGMQSLIYAAVRNYLPGDAGQIATGAQYFRLLPGNTCTSGGSTTPSHAGSIVNSNGQLEYYPSTCASLPQPIGSVEVAAYDPRFFAYQNGIFELFASPPDPAAHLTYNRILCQNSNGLSEGADVVVRSLMGTPPNLLSNASDLSAQPWTDYSGCTVTGTPLPAPDGRSVVYKMTEVLGGTQHYFRQNFTQLTDNGIYVFSVFAKGAGRNLKLNVHRKDGQAYTCAFDLVSGVACAPGIPLANGIEPYGDGWYRIWAAYDVGSGTDTPSFYFELRNGTAILYPGDGVSGVYLANPKVEEGKIPSPVSPLTAEIFTGTRESAGATYVSGTVSPFAVNESTRSAGTTYSSDVFPFKLDIQNPANGQPATGRLQAIINQQAIDLNLNCWREQ